MSKEDLPDCTCSKCKAARDVLMLLAEQCDTDNQKLSVLVRVLSQVLVDSARENGKVNEAKLDATAGKAIEDTAQITQNLVEDINGNPDLSALPPEVQELAKAIMKSTGGRLVAVAVPQGLGKHNFDKKKVN